MPPPEDPIAPEDVQVGRAKSLWASFGYAWAGLLYSLRTQRNFRIHIVAAILVIIAGLILSISILEWAIIAVVIVMVLAAEMANTVVEALVDMVTEKYHPLAKVAKDVSAGMVLLTAIGAVVVGVLVFFPKLLQVFNR